MAEYVEREALRRAIWDVGKRYCERMRQVGEINPLNALVLLSIAEVVAEVDNFPAADVRPRIHNCPFCGARMDGGSCTETQKDT